MSRNKENLRDITTFLMMNNTNPTKGFTAAEITAAVPSLKEPSVYRILRENPQFVQTTNSIHPKRYYFDPLQVKVVREANDSMSIRPEYKAESLNLHVTLQRLLDSLRDERGPLYREVANIAKAGNNAILFQQNKEPLKPSDWEAAKYSIDNLEQFAATLYQRMYALKTDERYNTPEWWAMFTKEK